MIVFAVVISLVNTTVDYLRLREQAIDNNQFQVKQIEESIVQSIKNIEKAYYFFDQDTSKKMESSSKYLIDLYEENPYFDNWDFDELKKLIGFDIYIINENNEITHSSFIEDVGLDFTVCCGKLAKIIEDRRNSGEFFSDGLDIEQKTGEIKKYSYMATPDKKFVIELGYSLQDGTIFNEYNFLQVKHELEEKYSSIDEVNILNIGGFSLGEPINKVGLSKDRRAAFEKTLQSGQQFEITCKLGNERVLYRYVPYTSAYDLGSTKSKVIEIAYNQKELQSLLHNNYKLYVVQFSIVLLGATIISFIISNWISKPMHLAFHDSLTGLKNRAAFNEILEDKIAENKSTLALMIIDLDDFKLVNDTFGHTVGDQLLKQVAQNIQSVIRKEDIAIRLGGDEFVLIMPSTNREEVTYIAESVIERIKEAVKHIEKVDGIISASIGIALTPEHGDDPELLYRKADYALYSSKNKGKNQYHIFTKNHELKMG